MNGWETCLLGAFCYLLGVLLPLSGRRKAAEKEPACGCGHHVAFHDPRDGRCHATVRTATNWSYTGQEICWELAQCACARYIGPEPVPDAIDLSTTGEQP